MLRRADLVSLVLPGAIWGSSYLFIRIVVPVVGPWGMVVPRMLGDSLRPRRVARRVLGVSGVALVAGRGR